MMGTAPCANASNRRLELGLSPEIMRQNSDCCSRCEYRVVWLALWREQSTHLPHHRGQHRRRHCCALSSCGCLAVRVHSQPTDALFEHASGTAWRTLTTTGARTSTGAGARRRRRPHEHGHGHPTGASARRATRTRVSRLPGRAGSAPRQVEACRHRAALGEVQVDLFIVGAHKRHVVLRQRDDPLGHLSSEVVGWATVHVACDAGRTLRALSCMPAECSGLARVHHRPVPMKNTPLSRGRRLLSSCPACLPVRGATALCRYGTAIVQRQGRRAPCCSGVSKCAIVILASACSLVQHHSVSGRANVQGCAQVGLLPRRGRTVLK